MKVKALVPHTNVYGDSWAKEVGDIYEVPDRLSAVLIESGIVETAEAAAPTKAKREAFTGDV